MVGVFRFLKKLLLSVVVVLGLNRGVLRPYPIVNVLNATLSPLTLGTLEDGFSLHPRRLND